MLQDSRAPYQPDPLQLKLSSLGGGGGTHTSSSDHARSYAGRGVAVQRSEREYGFSQRGGSSNSYSSMRDPPPDPYPRKAAGYTGDVARCVCVCVCARALLF